MNQAVSPCGSVVATLSSNERISFYKLFEKRKVNLEDPDDRNLFLSSSDDRATTNLGGDLQNEE